VPCWLGCFSTSTAHPGLQNRKSTGSSGTACTFAVAFRAGLDTRDGVAGLRALEARRAADIFRDALMVALSVTRRAGVMIGLVLLYFSNFILLTRTDYFQDLLSLAYGLRRSTIILSVRRLCRVFAPRVGKPQGVCG
jgi:hypothetical protein